MGIKIITEVQREKDKEIFIYIYIINKILLLTSL